MYLKSKGRNIILKERTRQPMGWPGAAALAQQTPVNPLSALALPGTPAASWQQLANQANPHGTMLDPLAALKSTNFAPQPANNNPLAALQRPQAPPPSGGGGFFSNLLSGIQGAAQNLIQGGVDIAGKLSSGGGSSAPQAPMPAMQTSGVGGIGLGTVLMLGGAGVVGYVLLKKKKA